MKNEVKIVVGHTDPEIENVAVLVVNESVLVHLCMALGDQDPDNANLRGRPAMLTSLTMTAARTALQQLNLVS